MSKQTIKDILLKITLINEDAAVFAKKIDNRFTMESEVVLLELNEDDQNMPTADLAKLKCPGYEYFLEVFLIQDLCEDLQQQKGYRHINTLAEGIIYYAENDA